MIHTQETRFVPSQHYPDTSGRFSLSIAGTTQGPVVPQFDGLPGSVDVKWASCFARFREDDLTANNYASLTSANALINEYDAKPGQSLTDTFRGGRLLQFLLSMIYLASNNLLSTRHASSALQLIRLSKSSDLFRALASGRFPAMKAIARTFLPEAVKSGDIPLVKALLTTGIDPNLPLNYAGKTVLEFAAHQSDTDMTTFLLSQGADPNVSPCILRAAVATDNVQLVRVLCRAGARDDFEMRLWGNPERALRIAAGKNNYEMVQLLLFHGADVDAVIEDDGKTALEAAAATGNRQLVQLLLYSGAVNLSGALPAAIHAGNSDVVQLLMKSGADTTGYLAKKNEETALQAAAYVGDYDLAQVLLGLGASINAPATFTDGMTALQGAAYNGNLRLVQLLLSHGAEINASSGWAELTALQAAASSGHVAVVQALLQSGADICPKYSKTRALGKAIETQNLELIRLLIRSGAALNGDSPLCDTPLSLAVETGQLHLVQLLLSEGADPCDHEALELAVCRNSFAIVKLLLDSGADADSADLDGVSVIEVAVRQTEDWEANSEVDLDIIQLLLHRGADKRRALREVASMGDTEVAQLLLDSGADVNGSPTAWTSSPLVNAAAVGDLKMVRLLLGYGANDRSKALVEAARSSNIELVRLLLRSGADVNFKETGAYSSFSALEKAAEGDNVEIVSHLLHCGADTNISDSGQSALETAAANGNVEIVRLLLNSGVDVVRIEGSTGDDMIPSSTPLQVAARLGHFGVVDELIKRGADVNSPPQSQWGRTALEGAEEHGRLDTVQLLINAGANIHSSRALHYAQKEGHDAVVTLLLQY